MREQIRSLAIAASLMVAGVSANAAGAAGIVFDPTDFVKDIMTAANTVKTATESAQQTIHQYKMVENWIKNLKQSGAQYLMGQLDPMTAQHAADFIKFATSLKELETDIGDLHKRFETKAKAAFDQKMTVADFVKWQQKQAEQGVKAAQLSLDGDVATLKRVEKTYGMVQDWQEKIPGIEGTVQGLQLLNTQMNAMVGQNAEIVTALTRQSMAKTLADQDQVDNERLNRAAAARAQSKSIEDAKALAGQRQKDFDDAQDPNRFKKVK